jgi:hypothetical protein
VAAEPVAVRLSAPYKVAVRGPQRVEVPVVGAEEDAAVVVREGALHGSSGLERPDRLAVDCAEAVDVPLGVADEQAVADEERRGLARSELLLPADQVRRPGGDREQFAVSPLSRITAARLLVEERLVDRAAAEAIDRR